MYLKNWATPAPVYAKVVNAADGEPITTGVVAYHVTGSTRSTVAGTAAIHVANGLWAYTPTQAETNYSQFAIEFYHADAVADGPIVEVVTWEASQVQAAAAAAITAAGVYTGTPPTVEQIQNGLATEGKQDEIMEDIAAIVPAGGIYIQTVTAKTTGGVAIPNATVAIYSGSVLIDIKTTNSSGIAQPMCDANPAYTLRVTATGYASYSAALAVTGDATLADIVLSSSETTIAPSADQAKTTAYWIVYGADTMPVGEDDVTATIWIIKMPSDHGAAYVDNPVQTISTTTNGILSATLFKGATYQIALSDGREWVVEVPLKAGTTYKMPPIRVAEA